MYEMSAPCKSSHEVVQRIPASNDAWLSCIRSQGGPLGGMGSPCAQRQRAVDVSDRPRTAARPRHGGDRAAEMSYLTDRDGRMSRAPTFNASVA